uniref:Orf_Bo072 n=1 Tax=Agrobacterium tumefaciens TaxID=358 RepID=A5WXZ2_AGRTU|nr:orf_Bo072 [Agrobacterium tumefaciens]UVZ00045.1 hypothetical protein K4M19_00354 [Agrobacterium fabrum]
MEAVYKYSSNGKDLRLCCRGLVFWPIVVAVLGKEHGDLRHNQLQACTPDVMAGILKGIGRPIISSAKPAGLAAKDNRLWVIDRSDRIHQAIVKGRRAERLMTPQRSVGSWPRGERYFFGFTTIGGLYVELE